jgi:hypothetical protein
VQPTRIVSSTGREPELLASKRARIATTREPTAGRIAAKSAASAPMPVTNVGKSRQKNQGINPMNVTLEYQNDNVYLLRVGGVLKKREFTTLFARYHTLIAEFSALNAARTAANKR